MNVESCSANCCLVVSALSAITFLFLVILTGDHGALWLVYDG
jgi:fucose permease